MSAHRHGLWIAGGALLVAGQLAGCATEGGGAASTVEALRERHARDAGTGDGGGAGTPLCTLTPDAWVDVCDDAGGGGHGHRGRGAGHWHGCGRGHLRDGEPTRRECAALRSTETALRERTALDLNLRRERSRLSDLHFSHGYRAIYSAEEIAALASRRAPSAETLAAVVDANRAFPECEDRRVLVPWVTTPICGGRARDRVEGPETMRCVELDGPCGRGVFDETNACCRVELAPPGLGCGAGSGVCDGGGACVEPSSVPAPVSGVGRWVEVLPLDADASYAPFESRAIDGHVEIREALVPLAAVPSAVQPSPNGGASSRVAVVRPESAVRLIAIDGLDDGVTRALFFELGGHPVVPFGDDEAELPYLDAVPPTELVGNVLVFAGHLDDLPAVLSDGSTPGTVTVPCPGSAGGFVCEIERTGRAFVAGPDLALAWQPSESSAFDLLSELPGIIVPIGGMIGGGPGGGLGGAGGGAGCGGSCAPMTVGATTCTRARYCIGRGGGTCVVTALERCDGADNDCDGVIDDGASASCNDGINCTIDYCDATPEGGGAPRCVSDALWGSATCRDSGCDIGICDGTSVVGAGPGDTTTPPDVNGCQQILRHSWCQNTWDSCACDGANELCLPAPLTNAALAPLPPGVPVGLGGTPARSGCFAMPNCGPPPPLVPLTPPPGLPAPNDPCDTDGNYCSVPRLCVEPDISCRAIRRLPPTDRAAAAANIDAAAACLAAGGLGGFCVPASPGSGSVCIAAPPLNLPCGNDGRPCTNDGVRCVAATCSCLSTAALGAVPGGFSPAGANVVLGESVGASLVLAVPPRWEVDERGPVCTGDPYLGVFGPDSRSCYTMECSGGAACLYDDNPLPPGPSNCTSLSDPAACGRTFVCSSTGLITPLPSGVGAPWTLGCVTNTGCAAPAPGYTDLECLANGQMSGRLPCTVCAGGDVLARVADGTPCPCFGDGTCLAGSCVSASGTGTPNPNGPPYCAPR